MADIIYVTKEYYSQQVDRIRKLEENLKLIRKTESEAYENCGDGWHDNPFYNHLIQEERSSDYRLGEEVAKLSQFSVFDSRIVPENPDTAMLGTYVNISERNMETGEVSTSTIGIVPLGAEDMEKNLFPYYAPRVRPLIGKEIGESAIVTIPKGSWKTTILSVSKLDLKELEKTKISEKKVPLSRQNTKERD